MKIIKVYKGYWIQFIRDKSKNMFVYLQTCVGIGKGVNGLRSSNNGREEVELRGEIFGKLRKDRVKGISDKFRCQVFGE